MGRVCLVHLIPKGSHLILSEKSAVCPDQKLMRFFFNLCSQKLARLEADIQKLRIVCKVFTSKLKLELGTRG